MVEKIITPDFNTSEAEINSRLADFRQKLSSVEQELSNKKLSKLYRKGLLMRKEDLDKFIDILEEVLQEINQE